MYYYLLLSYGYGYGYGYGRTDQSYQMHEWLLTMAFLFLYWPQKKSF